MKLRNWLRRWRHRRQWKKAEKGTTGPLREFVYLDEVSVYSLVASQVGPIVTEVTDTQASSLQTELSSTLGAAGPVKAEVGSKLQTGETQSSQVLRKAIIQTTFKQLHDTALKSGALQLHADRLEPVSVRSLEDVKTMSSEAAYSRIVIPPHRLKRGDLFEMEVQLEAEPIFQAGMAVSAVLEIIQDDPTMYGVADVTQLAQVRLMSRMLDKVLAGLVPVRGRALNFVAVDIDDEEWLLHVDLVKQVDTPPTIPVFIVGVAQQALFWKDVRRVLFSGSEYRVLARLNRSGLQKAWTPVKLVDVLSTVVPDFADVMDTFNRDVLSTMSGAVAAQQNAAEDLRVRSTSLAYAAMLAEREGIAISEDDLQKAGVLAAGAAGGPLGVREWRELLAPVTRLIETRTGRSVDRQVAADYRTAAVAQAGLLEAAAPLTESAVGGGRKAPERFLDSEIVAVYW